MKPTKWEVVLSDGRNNERRYYPYEFTQAEAFAEATTEWAREFGCIPKLVSIRSMKG